MAPMTARKPLSATNPNDVRNVIRYLISLVILMPGIATPLFSQSENYIRVSPRDHRYLEYADGTAYVPIGLNMIGVGNATTEEGLAQMDKWMSELAANGGNFMRLWLSNNFWDVEHSKSGEYDSLKASERLDRVIQRATQLGLKVKVTVEHFRNFRDTGWDAKALHDVSNGGTAASVPDFFRGARSRELFVKKLDWYAARYGLNPDIIIWELWNEVNAVSNAGYALEDASEQYDWTVVMLGELKKRFPDRLVTQSLGSFDDARVRQTYQAFCTISKNDLAQVHRYLDLGAQLPICHAAVDVLAVDAVKELRAFQVDKPLLLAESGAVEPKHSGPSKLYAADQAGIILHDVLFAPFFAGAAGAGQIWHWGEYVDKNNLWFHFARFSEAIKDIDVPGEGFVTTEEVTDRLRIYGLKGKHTTLLWCRDAENTWMTELKEGKAPAVIKNYDLDISNYIGKKSAEVNIYDPWKDQWSRVAVKNGKVRLPEFTRSVVVRVR
jgi:hypothetical protein